MTDLAYLLQLSAQTEHKAQEGPVEHYALPSFKRALDNRPEDAVQHPDTVRQELAKGEDACPIANCRTISRSRPTIGRRPELDPLDSDLPLWKTNPSLKMTDPSRPQPRYQMQLWLEAVDNDLDSDKTKDGRPQPHLKVSEEKFTFFLVSENELLTEIAKEEETAVRQARRALSELAGHAEQAGAGQSRSVQLRRQGGRAGSDERPHRSGTGSAGEGARHRS